MNAKMTKLKKNYVVLATLIAVLGVIFALFFAINSFADDTNAEPAVNNEANVTYTVSGTLFDTSGNPVEGAEVSLYTGEDFLKSESSSTGDFSISVTEGTYIVSFIADTTSGLRYHKQLFTTITSDVPLGNLNMFYTSVFDPYVNGAFTSEGAGGKWEISGDPTPVMGVYNLDYKSGSYTISGKVVTFNYVDIDGASKTWTWTFTENSGYTFDTIEIIDNPSSVNSNNNLVPGEWKAFNAKTTGGAKTITISGKLVDLNSNPVEGAEIYGYSSDIEGGQFTGTSSSTGEFSIAVSVPGGTLNSFSFQAIKTGIPGQKAGLRRTYGYSTPTTEDVDTGDVSMNYYVGYAESINGDYVAENAFGKWTYNYNGGAQIEFKSGTVSVEDNVVTFSYIDINGTQQTETETFTPKAGYELDHISLEGKVPPGPFTANNGAVDLASSSYWTLNAITGYEKYTVTFDENISQVTVKGQSISSGDKVEYGSTVFISLAEVQAGKIAKITVNGAVIKYNYAIVDGDMNISANVVDKVTISGVVKADESAVANGNKDFSNIFVEKAYAAEVGVEGATVSFTSTDGWNTQTLTDAEGAYALDVEKGMGGVLIISKEGFNTFTKEFTDAELNEDVQVTSELVKASSPQTGDITLYAFAVIALVLSGAVVLRISRRPKGLHIK